jgi:regulator of sigma D
MTDELDAVNKALDAMTAITTMSKISNLTPAQAGEKFSTMYGLIVDYSGASKIPIFGKLLSAYKDAFDNVLNQVGKLSDKWADDDMDLLEFYDCKNAKQMPSKGNIVRRALNAL